MSRPRRSISPDARDPNKRWWGVYANYNTPAYNAEKVKASELPEQLREFMERKQWAGKVTIDRTDNELAQGHMELGEDEAPGWCAGSWRRSARRHRWLIWQWPVPPAARQILGVPEQLRQPLDEREACGQPHRGVAARCPA
jgi:hypothetical protein